MSESQIEIPVRAGQAILDVAVLPQGFMHANLVTGSPSNDSKIPAKYKFRFLIDTGARISCISAHVAESCGFALSEQTRIIQNTHGTVECDQYQVELYLLGLGEGYIIDKMPTIDLRPDHHHHGLLGMDVIMLGELNVKGDVCTFRLG